MKKYPAGHVRFCCCFALLVKLIRLINDTGFHFYSDVIRCWTCVISNNSSDIMWIILYIKWTVAFIILPMYLTLAYCLSCCYICTNMLWSDFVEYYYVYILVTLLGNSPDSKVHGANMGPIWGRQDPGGPHVGPMDFAIWEIIGNAF